MTRSKTALVTGGNKGLGFEVARQLATRGYKVWIGAREIARGMEAEAALRAAGDVNFVQLDVTDQASVDAAAATLAQAAGHLDVLVNNAGIYVKSGDGAPSVTSPDVMLATYAVNVLGPVRVTNAMLGLLRAAGRANIVMVSSGLGSLHRHLDPASGFARNQTLAYSSSKSALNAITIGYANELREAGFKVNAANPGFVATDLNGRTGTKTTEEGAAIIVELATLGEGGPTGGFFSQNSAEPW